MPKIKANGIELEYAIAGDTNAPAILLVSGYTAQMTRWPPELVNGLSSAGYQVIMYDNRDIGLSHQFEDKGVPDIAKIFEAIPSGGAMALAPYLLNDMAADAAGLLDALNVERAHVLGASMGGMIAQLMALDFPEKVASLMPVMTTSGDPNLPPSSPEAMAALTRQPDSPAKEHIIANALISQKAIGSAPEIRSSEAEIAERIGSDYDRAYRPMGILRQYAAIVAQPRWHERLASLTVPTRVIHGEVDPLIRPAAGQDIAKRVPGAEYVEVPKWGHDIPALIVPELVRIVTEFTKRVDSA